MAFEADETLPASGATILVVDDEPNLRRVLSAVLTREGHTVLVADSGRDAIKKAKQQERLDLLVTDFLMPDLNGLQVLETVRKQHPDLRALVISGHGTVRSAVDAMRLGAFDFITKPFDVEKVRETVERALRVQANSSLPDPEPTGGTTVKRLPDVLPAAGSNPATSTATYGLIGDAPATRQLRVELLRAAPARATVLLLGESGTGKEVGARLLHEAGPRARAPFVAVSCAALPDTLLESELFGYEKSAFTGALAAKPGRFEMADGGTLFLDEIGDISAPTQVKLLRALQEREVSRIGATRTVKVDVRVVAATNRDLWQAVQEGTFRLDLYYRLHIIPIILPPLRERRDDIPVLAEHFLQRAARENGRVFSGGIAPSAVSRLIMHSWPGNIRELQNVMEYVSVMAPPGATCVEAASLPPFPPSVTGAEETLRAGEVCLVAGSRAKITRGQITPV